MQKLPENPPTNVQKIRGLPSSSEETIGSSVYKKDELLHFRRNYTTDYNLGIKMVRKRTAVAIAKQNKTDGAREIYGTRHPRRVTGNHRFSFTRARRDLAGPGGGCPGGQYSSTGGGGWMSRRTIFTCRSPRADVQEDNIRSELVKTHRKEHHCGGTREGNEGKQWETV
jgi:hypothetical protein